MLHSASIYDILNRKIITKEMLLSYLTKENVSVQSNYTKIALIERIVSYWKTREENIQRYQPKEKDESTVTQNEEFSVNKLSQEFSLWFFKRLNDGDYNTDDFWSDALSSIRIISNDSNNIIDETTSGSDNIVIMFKCLKDQLRINFIPNLTAQGVQGRMDPHGLVYVLCCGTIQKDNTFSGIFETAFGLIRNIENMWRIKNLKLQIRNSETYSLPNIQECSTLQEFIKLPIKYDDA